MIEHIKVNGYRLFKDFETKLQPGINVLLGANATGKSSFIELLRIIHSCALGPVLPPGLEAAPALGNPFHPDAEETIVCTVALNLPQRGEDPNTRYTYGIQIKGVAPPQIGAEEIWRPRHPRQETPPRPATIEEQEARLGGEDGLVRDEGLFRILKRSWGHGQIAEGANYWEWFPASNEPLLSHATDPHQQQCFLVRNAILGWRFHVDPYVTRSAQSRQPPPIAGELVLDATGSNLASVLLTLATNLEFREQWDELQSFLSAAMPEFIALTPMPVPGTRYAAIQWRERDVSATLSAADLSDGVLRLLILGVICLSPHPPTLICIDEPAIGLHPKVLPLVGGLLRRAARSSQVIVLTHSPEMLYGMPLESIAVMRKENGEAQIVWPREHKVLYEILTEEVAGERELNYERLSEAFFSGELDQL
jgi:predicted ATPase